jgi:hypothetical protein
MGGNIHLWEVSMDNDDVHRLFMKCHAPLTPEETIDGEPDERIAMMSDFARTLSRFGYDVMRKCPPNAERDICIRKLYEALIYADLSLMLDDYDQQPRRTPRER